MTWEIGCLILGLVAAVLAFSGFAGALTGALTFVCLAVFVVTLMVVGTAEVNGRGHLT